MFGLTKKRPLHEVMAEVDAETIPHSRFAEAATSEPLTTSSVVTLRKPDATTPIFPPLPDLDQFAEYEALANEIGYAPSEIRTMRAERSEEEARRAVVSFLLDSGLPYYDNDAVKSYMDKLCEMENQRLSEFDRRYGRVEWTWVPTTGQPRQFLSSDGKVHDYIEGGYSKAIPVEMLRRAAKIKAQFKDATFAVTDYRAVNPDPFISVRTPAFSKPVIFGVWDEPGFGAIGRDAKPEQGDGR